MTQPRKSVAIGLILGVLQLTTSAWNSTPSTAAYNPCGSQSNYQEGWQTGGTPVMTLEGVSAALTYRHIYECTYPAYTYQNLVSAWTMVASADTTGWAQSGYWYYHGIGNNCMSHFAQQVYNYPTNAPTTVIGSCVSDHESHQAWQQTVYVGGSSNWAVRSNIDVTIFIQSAWNQFSVWSQPLRAVNDGETSMMQSDVPGTPSNVDDWSSIQVQSYANDAFYSACGSAKFYPITSLSRFSVNQPSCQETQSWTNSPT